MLTVALTLAGGAGAQTIQDLSQKLSADQVKLASLNKIMAESARTDASLNKEYKGYVAEQKRKRVWAKRAVAEVERKVKAPIVAKIRKISEDYNSHCATSRVGKLRRPQYDRCIRWKARVQRERKKLARHWSRYSKEWNDKNIKLINAAFARQSARMKQIDAQMKASFKRNSDAQDSFFAATRRIKQKPSSRSRPCALRTSHPCPTSRSPKTNARSGARISISTM